MPSRRTFLRSLAAAAALRADTSTAGLILHNGNIHTVDPANPNVIKTGKAPEYMRCQNTIAAVPVTDELVAALVQTKSLGDINVSRPSSTARTPRTTSGISRPIS